MGNEGQKLEGLSLAAKYNSYERTQFNPQNIEMQTDLTHEEVWTHSLANKLSDIAMEKFGVDLKIRELLFEKELRAPSDNRKSREEATQVYRAAIKAEGDGEQGGTLSALKGK